MMTNLRKIVIHMTRMTIYALIVCQAFAMTYPSDSRAQRSMLADISIHLDNDGKEEWQLIDLISFIESKSDFVFSYSENKIETLKVKLTQEDWVMMDLLKEISIQGNISIKRVNENIALNKVNSFIKSPEVSEVVFAQEIIKGTIANENGEPLPGATVQEKGTGNGTITDVEGAFSLNVNEGATLVFSSVGYISQEVNVGDRTVINVVMVEDIQALEGVVVVGYGTQKKVNLTGAVDQISSKSIESISVPNVSRALQGQIPGLNISFNSGRPTDNPSYNIRGLTSIGAGGSALILIDGIEGDPANLNPNDIESITVLKDASSAAIYGSRGAFGVVLITTKRPQKEQIKYTSVFSQNTRTAQRDVLQDSYTWAKMYMESYTNLYANTRKPTSVGNIGILFSEDLVDELKYRKENPNHGLPDVGINPDNGHYMYYGNTDWWSLLYKEYLPSMEHTLSASGSSDRSAFSVSGSYFTQDGLYNIRSDKYNKYNLRIKGFIQPLKWLKLTSNISFSAYDYSDPFSDSNIWHQLQSRSGATPFAVPYNPDGTYTQAGSVSIGVLEGMSKSETQNFEILGITGFEASIVNNYFNLKGNFSFRERVNETNRKYIPVPYSNYPGVITTVGESRLWNNRNTESYYVYNLYGDFKHNFGHHSLSILSGINVETTSARYLNVNRNDLIIDELESFNLATGENFSISGSGSDWANAGIFTRINYAFKEKYLFEINSRYDGSSKFPKEDQFGFFPSFSVGWIISEENFLTNTNNWLDNLKMRVSYGSLGNSQIAPYLYQEQINARQTSKILQGEKVIVINEPEVLPDDFTWETSTTINTGIDIDLLQYRLGLVFDWFRRTTTNMITVGPTLPAVFGAASPKGNYADMETRGFELTLRWRDRTKTSKPFIYDVRLTLADNVTDITKYNNPTRSLIINPANHNTEYFEGMRVGDVWGLTTSGLFVDQEDIDNHADQSFIIHNWGGLGAQPGDVKFEDINGDGKIDWGTQTLDDPGDLSIIGNESPRYTYGIALNGRYGNFSLSAFFQGVGKRDWYPGNAVAFWGPYGYWGSEIPTHFIGTAYTNDNPDPNAYWPRYKGNMAYGKRQLQPQTRYLQNTAYIRLKNINLAYSLPKHLSEKLNMDDIQVFFTGQNIWSYSPVYKITKDLDVEMNVGSGFYYPILKSYSLGINLSF